MISRNTIQIKLTPFLLKLVVTLVVSKNKSWLNLFFMKKKGWRGRPMWQSYLSVIIVVPYPLGPRPCWGAEGLQWIITSQLHERYWWILSCWGKHVSQSWFNLSIIANVGAISYAYHYYGLAWGPWINFFVFTPLPNLLTNKLKNIKNRLSKCFS